MAASKVAAALLIVLFVTASAAQGRSPRTIRVPQDQPTVTAGIAAAGKGDVVLLDRGTYAGGITVPKTKPGITIRGVDRNTVVFDGKDTEDDAIIVLADDVTLENMTAHGFRHNGFYWDDVKGFRGSYLTVWNVLGYGIYAEGSTDGVIDHDYVSGAGDAAFYVGECRPCRATLHHVTARLSAVGYSGTNASGALTIRDSLWDRNGAGILPNSYANEKDPPQSDLVISNNRVVSSGRARVPLDTPIAGFYGVGIAIAGGNRDQIRGNTVTGSRRYGVAVFRTDYWVSLDPRPHPAGKPWRPAGNSVRGNTVSGSGIADLALSATARVGNCFRVNRVRTTQPPKLQTRSCAKPGGDVRVSRALERSLPSMNAAARAAIRPIPYSSVPAPPPQPNRPPG